MCPDNTMQYEKNNHKLQPEDILVFIFVTMESVCLIGVRGLRMHKMYALRKVRKSPKAHRGYKSFDEASVEKL